MDDWLYRDSLNRNKKFLHNLFSINALETLCYLVLLLFLDREPKLKEYQNYISSLNPSINRGLNLCPGLMIQQTLYQATEIVVSHVLKSLTKGCGIKHSLNLPLWYWSSKNSGQTFQMNFKCKIDNHKTSYTSLKICALLLINTIITAILRNY